MGSVNNVLYIIGYVALLTSNTGFHAFNFDFLSILNV